MFPASSALSYSSLRERPVRSRVLNVNRLCCNGEIKSAGLSIPQPDRNLFWLHCFLQDLYQLCLQSVHRYFITGGLGEVGQHLLGVVLFAIEAVALLECPLPGQKRGPRQ